MDKEHQTIYLYLCSEGTDVWRPVKAKRIENDIYRIVSLNETPEDEQWQFNTGDIVRCEFRVFSGGESGIVAVDRISNSI
jgi:hypothetical protein